MNLDMHVVSDLVSVVVVSYNSSSYIRGTLESIKEQTYPKIELVISDDCSTDDTIDISQRWVDENKDRFYRVIILRASSNIGVSGNLNKGINASTGIWIKTVAGDDKLPAHSIEQYVEFVNRNKDCRICFAKLSFEGDDLIAIRKAQQNYEELYYPLIRAEQHVQYINILKKLYIPGPGLFFKKALWAQVGGFDERYPMMEEWPFALNVLESGCRIYFIDKYLYRYLIRSNSLSHQESNGMSFATFMGVYNYFYQVRIKKMLRSGLFLHVWHNIISLYCTKIQYEANMKNHYNNIIHMLYCFSPLSYVKLIRRVLRGRL